MSGLSLYQSIAIAILPLLFAITVHEFAHGWIAKRLGDPTAQRLGRLTLNPVKHVDPVGTILVPMALLLTTGYVFGWARPMPITYKNLRHPKRDFALVTLAGPGANLLMAMVWALIAKLSTVVPEQMAWVSEPLYYMGIVGISINFVFMVLNLLPLPPLDGGRLAGELLPGRWGWNLNRIEPYGFFIVVALLLTDVLGYLLHPFLHTMTMFLHSFAGLS